MSVPRVGALAVVVRERAVLLVRRTLAPHAGCWGFPGGRVEYGERLVAAAQRELLEETGLVGTAAQVVDIDETVLRSADGTVSAHWLLAAVAIEAPNGSPVLDHEASAYGWFTPEAWPTPLIPAVPRIAALAIDWACSKPV